MSDGTPKYFYNPSTSICDFCSSHEIVIAYQVADFLMAKIDGIEECSAGAWVACRDCEELIDRHDIEGLLKHALTTFEILHPECSIDEAAMRFLEGHLRPVYAKFFTMERQKVALAIAQ